jgi:hypothetical protein
MKFNIQLGKKLILGSTLQTLMRLKRFLFIIFALRAKNLMSAYTFLEGFNFIPYVSK